MKYKKNALKEVEDQQFAFYSQLEKANPDPESLRSWEVAHEWALWYAIYAEALEYIVSGMSPEEFVLKTCEFCADVRSNPKAVTIRSYLLLSVIDFQVPGEPLIEELPTTK